MKIVLLNQDSEFGHLFEIGENIFEFTSLKSENLKSEIDSHKNIWYSLLL